MFNQLWSSKLLAASVAGSLPFLTATSLCALEVENSSELINESSNPKSAQGLDEVEDNRVVSERTLYLGSEQTIVFSYENTIDSILQSNSETKDTQILDQVFTLSERSVAEFSHSERLAEVSMTTLRLHPV